MARLGFGIIVAVIVFTIYAVVDCAMIERSRVRGVPRWVWMLIIVLLMPIGGALWFIIGRGRRGHTRRPVAPDDDPDFLNRLASQKEQQERIRRLERELADLDDETSGKKHKPGSDPDAGRRDA